MNLRRSYIEVIAEMLRVSEKGVNKTEILYSANMSHYQLQKYLSSLLAHGFIDRLTTENSHFNYRVTKRGSKLLKSIDNILEALGFESK